MKCPCGNTVHFLLGDGLCSGCPKRDEAAPPPPKPPRKHPKRVFLGKIPRKDWEPCKACRRMKEPKEGEYPAHYRQRDTCSSECHTAHLRVIRRGNQNARKKGD